MNMIRSGSRSLKVLARLSLSRSRKGSCSPCRMLQHIRPSTKLAKRHLLLSDERIEDSGSSPFSQLLPACLSGFSVGTYAAGPGVLGPQICCVQGIVAQTATDFSMSALVPASVAGGVMAAVCSATLAPFVKQIGVRRMALLASALFPGSWVAQAAAISYGHFPAYCVSTAVCTPPDCIALTLHSCSDWCAAATECNGYCLIWWTGGRRLGILLHLPTGPTVVASMVPRYWAAGPCDFALLHVVW